MPHREGPDARAGSGSRSPAQLGACPRSAGAADRAQSGSGQELLDPGLLGPAPCPGHSLTRAVTGAPGHRTTPGVNQGLIAPRDPQIHLVLSPGRCPARVPRSISPSPPDRRCPGPGCRMEAPALPARDEPGGSGQEFGCAPAPLLCRPGPGTGGSRSAHSPRPVPASSPAAGSAMGKAPAAPPGQRGRLSPTCSMCQLGHPCRVPSGPVTCPRF